LFLVLVLFTHTKSSPALVEKQGENITTTLSSFATLSFFRLFWSCSEIDLFTI